MKKIKIWDWAAGKFRSSKIFNRSRENPPPTLSEINAGIERLTIEQATLEAKKNRTLQEEERLGEIRKEINRLANTDTGQRYMKFDYGGGSGEKS